MAAAATKQISSRRQLFLLASLSLTLCTVLAALSIISYWKKMGNSSIKSNDSHNGGANNFMLPFNRPESTRSMTKEFFHLVDDALPASTTPLRDIHMVLIGDSMMRYQYLSLVYRLRHGLWFNNSQWRHNLVCERSFQNPFHNQTWGEFMFQSNGILHPFEVCDCYRDSIGSMDNIIENRYYYDPHLNNSVTFLLGFGHTYPTFGRLGPQDVRKQREGWHQKQAFQEFKDKKPSWLYHDWSDLIRHFVRYLDPQPRHIILNAGLWDHRFGWSTPPTQNETGELSNDTIHLLDVVKQTPQYQYAWRTTNYNKNREYNAWETDQLMCQHLHTCVNVSFTKLMPRTMYSDLNHLLEPYYRVVNEDILDKFGYLPENYVRMNRSDLISGPLDMHLFEC